MKVAAIQANINSRDKWSGTYYDIMVKYQNLTKQAASDGAELIVWPETAVLYNEFIPDIASLAKDLKVYILFGCFDYMEDGNYFSVQSIKKTGFESGLFNLGFSDWFYAGLLETEERFSSSTMFRNIILYKGKKRITSQSFEESLILRHRSIDVYDLMSEMEEIYGCQISDRYDLIYKVSGTDIYYDRYLDRLYANIDIFNRELETMEGSY